MDNSQFNSYDMNHSSTDDLDNEAYNAYEQNCLIYWLIEKYYYERLHQEECFQLWIDNTGCKKKKNKQCPESLGLGYCKDCFLRWWSANGNKSIEESWLKVKEKRDDAEFQKMSVQIKALFHPLKIPWPIPPSQAKSIKTNNSHYFRFMLEFVSKIYEGGNIRYARQSTKEHFERPFENFLDKLSTYCSSNKSTNDSESNFEYQSAQKISKAIQKAGKNHMKTQLKESNVDIPISEIKDFLKSWLEDQACKVKGSVISKEYTLSKFIQGDSNSQEEMLYKCILGTIALKFLSRDNMTSVLEHPTGNDGFFIRYVIASKLSIKNKICLLDSNETPNLAHKLSIGIGELEKKLGKVWLSLFKAIEARLVSGTPLIMTWNFLENDMKEIKDLLIRVEPYCDSQLISQWHAWLNQLSMRMRPDAVILIPELLKQKRALQTGKQYFEKILHYVEEQKKTLKQTIPEEGGVEQGETGRFEENRYSEKRLSNAEEQNRTVEQRVPDEGDVRESGSCEEKEYSEKILPNEEDQLPLGISDFEEKIEDWDIMKIEDPSIEVLMSRIKMEEILKEMPFSEEEGGNEMLLGKRTDDKIPCDEDDMGQIGSKKFKEN